MALRRDQKQMILNGDGLRAIFTTPALDPQQVKLGEKGASSMAQKTVSELILFKGAYYALEQCGLLLRHSAILHKEQVASTAAGLALLAREELGKYRILLDLWRKAKDTGSCPSPEDIHHAIEDHVEKQKQAQLSVTNRMQGPGGL